MKNFLKSKTTIFFGTAICISFFYSTAVYAQPSVMEQLLLQIRDYTYGTLNAVNNLPDYLKPISALALGWLSPDDTTQTAQLQANFGNLVNAANQNLTTQNSIQPQLLGGFFGYQANPKTLPYANDLAYTTLLGQLYFNPDPRKNQNIDPAYNYLRNASGLGMTHEIPNPKWGGTNADIQNYINFYNTISAVQTYNGYVLSQGYAEAKNGNPLTTQQTTLIQQASSPDWFKQVATENIGVVLRQLLMFNSQMFVLLTQMLQTQKQMLISQAMTNTLIVVGNQFNESNLLNKAKGNA